MWLPPCLPGSGTCFPENSVVSGVSEGHVLQSRATHLLPGSWPGTQPGHPQHSVCRGHDGNPASSGSLLVSTQECEPWG